MHIPGVRKSGAFHIPIKKNWVSDILFVEKRGPIIYLAALKKGAIRHAHPYYAIYRKLPSTAHHPPSPRVVTILVIFGSYCFLIYNCYILLTCSTQLFSVYHLHVFICLNVTITKTCLYNFEPLKPHFYIVKLGFTLFFLFLLKNIGSNEYPQSMF